MTHPTFRKTIEAVLDDRNFSKMFNHTKSMVQNMSILSDKALEDHRTMAKSYENFYERL